MLCSIKLIATAVLQIVDLLSFALFPDSFRYGRWFSIAKMPVKGGFELIPVTIKHQLLSGHYARLNK
jgi:hypothetical protein